MLQVMLQTYIHILEMEEDRAQEEEGLATSKERKERRKKAQVNEQKKNLGNLHFVEDMYTVQCTHLITGNIWLDSLRLISCLFPLSSFTMDDAEPIFSNLRKFEFFL